MTLTGLRQVALHVDDAGQLGPVGEVEGMAFIRDVSGNLEGRSGRRAGGAP